MVVKDKQLERGSLAQLREGYRTDQKKVGFTSGVFDILHRGHVDYLRAAKNECDVLIVGVNADASVRAIKGPSRPVQEEADRLAVIASLEVVDHAFLFAEQNNNENIRQLKPDLYMKAGDYDRSKLTSAPLVEEHGGEIKLLSFVDGRSSTSVIQKIIDSELPQLAVHESYPPSKAAPAAFLDRDGTICKHVQYLSDPKQFELLPGVTEGLKLLQENGYRLVVITNQPGIGFGYFSKEDFYRVNLEMLRQLSAEGILIDKIYFSPSTKAANTPCRKPNVALGERAIKELNLIVKDSIMFGDAESDVAFAKNLGCKSCLISYSGEDVKEGSHLQVSSLLDGVKVLLATV